MPCSPPPRTPMPPMPTRSRKSRRASRPVWSTRPRDAASIRAVHASFRVYAMKRSRWILNRSRIISSPAGYIKDEEHAPLSDVGPGPVIFGCGPALFDGRQDSRTDLHIGLHLIRLINTWSRIGHGGAFSMDEKETLKKVSKGSSCDMRSDVTNMSHRSTSDCHLAGDSHFCV